MALQLLRKRTKLGGGRKTVQYRDTRGRTHDALVTSAGTGDTVNLRIRDRARGVVASQIIANVPLATSMKSTNAYFQRLS
jgi:hypothetical protein